MFEVDNVNISSSDDNFTEGSGVGDFFVDLPVQYGGCAKKSIEEAGNDPDGVLLPETPEIIVQAM